MRKNLIPLLHFFCCVPVAYVSNAAPLAVRVADLNEWLVETRKNRETREFLVTGNVTRADKGGFVLADETGRTAFALPYASRTNTFTPQAGDRVAIRGTASLNPSGGIQIGKRRKESALTRFVIEKIGQTPITPPTEVDLAKVINTEKLHLHTVRTVGTVVEVATDEIDATTAFVTLRCGTVFLPVIIDRDNLADFRKLKDSTIEIEGLFLQHLSTSLRKFVGPILMSATVTKILQRPPSDPFALPTIDGITFRPPREIATLGRRSARGAVLAAWNGDNVLIRTENDCAVRATLAQGEPLPPVGSTITIAGYPEVNLFHVSLKLAIWRKEPDLVFPADAPVRLDADEILGKRPGMTIDVTNHGRNIILRGIVQSLPPDDQPHGEMLIQNGSHIIKINPGTTDHPFSELTAGCEVAISGICILDGSPWQPHEVFPHLNEFKLVIRAPTDITILSRPPWMTTARLWKLVGLLLAALAIAFAWGTILSRIIRKRTHALVREQVERARSEFRIGERTRLAIELHDALSQGLTGVAGQIEATGSALAVRPEAAHIHLETASRMLQSCRTELRRCLWDLRGDALEDPNFEAALRKTILPVIGNARLRVRFSARRSRLSDTLAHAILCIARELAANAVQHGSATEIQIAGAHDPGRVSFSVSDNGRGFDPRNAPGPEQGHFGLSGIEERIQTFGGSLDFSRQESGGMRAVITLKCPEPSSGKPS